MSLFVPPDVVRLLEQRLQDVVREVAGEPMGSLGLELPLPTLSEDSPTKESPAWFPVPGMHGGFRYWLELDDKNGAPQLWCESWCRIVEGSGKRHLVTLGGTQLVDEGFV